MPLNLKTPLTAVMLSSLALVPATSVAFMATADMAIAKSDKGGGNGGSKGGGKGASQKSQKSKGGAKAKGGGKSASSGGSRGHTAFDGLFDKLTGKDKAKTKAASKSKAKVKTTTRTASAPKSVKAAPKARPTTDGLAPNELGKMNGALNANVNAIIAHVKNGNTNGPIGGMAALAIAGYAADGASETIETAGKYDTLDQLLIDNGYVDADGNPDVDAYLSDIAGTPGNGTLDPIETAQRGEGSLTLEEALLAENNGVRDFADLAEYEAWRDGTAGATPINEVDTLITDLAGTERPTDEEIEQANQLTEDRTAAEDYMLSIWNKGDGDPSVRSDSEQAMLDQLYERLEADGATLTNAIEEYADLPDPVMQDEPTIEDSPGCSIDDSSCDPADEEFAAAE